MDLVNAILNNNEEEFNKHIETADMNFTHNSFPFLWIAINGAAERPKIKKTSFANYNFIEKLLVRGADPNRKSILMTPLYASVFHNRLDVARLLLENGADPNEFTMVKCYSKQLICDLPLNIAFREFNIEMVELLLLYDAMYNKITIDKIRYGIRKSRKDERTSNSYVLYKQLLKIYKLLKDNYYDFYEDKVNDIINNSKKTGTYTNYYSCFQKKIDVIQ